mmetsp:Transcript_98868/g.176131  ORF Transcript_98868/g.176131 Transcript_98868/m.176131 type:complete len:178 (-) Transcript_98868:123-656(-)
MFSSSMIFVLVAFAAFEAVLSSTVVRSEVDAHGHTHHGHHKHHAHGHRQPSQEEWFGKIGGRNQWLLEKMAEEANSNFSQAIKHGHHLQNLHEVFDGCPHCGPGCATPFAVTFKTLTTSVSCCHEISDPDDCNDAFQTNSFQEHEMQLCRWSKDKCTAKKKFKCQSLAMQATNKCKA